VLLEVRNLSVSYAGCQALSNVSLTVAEREIVGLCGPNKAGKSTLCKSLAGATSQDGAEILNGEILFDGKDVTCTPASRRLPLGISLCPEGRGIYPGMTVSDNLRLSCDGLSRGDRKARMEELLSYFPVLGERLGQQAGTLSGGEAQMLGIARRLLQRPRILIVDEPSLGLAPKAIDNTFKALSKVRQDFGVSVLLVEEAIARLSGRVDRAYVLHLGTVVAEGEMDQLIGSSAVADAFMGEVGADLVKAGSFVRRA